MGADRAEAFGVSNSTDNEFAAKVPQDIEVRALEMGLRGDDLLVFLRHGFTLDNVPKVDSLNRRSMLAYLKKKEMAPPRWLMICGLYSEIKFEEVDRRKRIRALYKAVVLLIRRSLARQAADPFKSERTIFWDPIAEVCRELEIAQSKLSAFCKEFSGNSLSQVVDCVRVERVKKLMKGEIRAFVLGMKSARGATLGTENASRLEACTTSDELDAWGVWEALKGSRKWPEYSQNTWAMGFGFASYRRMYRACLAVYGMTPHQMEMEMIREVLEREETGDRDQGTVGEQEMGLLEIEEAVKGIRGWGDEGGTGHQRAEAGVG